MKQLPPPTSTHRKHTRTHPSTQQRTIVPIRRSSKRALPMLSAACSRMCHSTALIGRKRDVSTHPGVRPAPGLSSLQAFCTHGERSGQDSTCAVCAHGACCNVHHAVCGVRCARMVRVAMCIMQCAVRGVRAWCVLQCASCSVRCAVCAHVRVAMCIMQCAVCGETASGLKAYIWRAKTFG